MKKISKKNRIWIIIPAALAIIFVCLAFLNAASGGKAAAVSCIELYPSDLINSISIKGIVESAEKNNVYSSLGHPVKKLNVEVGDWVARGRILCELNTEDLENNLAQQKAQLNSSVQSMRQQIQISAVNLESAQKKYDDALKDSENGTTLDLDMKKNAYKNNQELFERGFISGNELSQSEVAYTSALNNYNGLLEQAKDALKTAQINYNNAIAANTDTQELVIKNLEKHLRDSVIRAPVSGTVTAVYAREGASGSGLLFVIEDTENLIIKTTIKEYDISNVKTGMYVIIKSDSTGSSVYEGIVSKIAPTAVKDMSGETASKSDVEFEAQVYITSRETDLKIGMNARLNVILEEKKHVYCVPYDAVMTTANGENYIFTAQDNGQNKQTAKQINVTTGLETDFYVEIFSAELFDGMKAISDVSSVRDGMLININTGGSSRGQRN
ncbi:MAG: HlyD family efflux transporter periplasmic adaptor subunit [Treponema sp.]|nr:HlyD family efflux transporter periplasmic adaptor subunit [Treponema sp.]